MKSHIITYRSVVIEEWLVEGARNATEARERFRNGEGRIAARSDFDIGVVLRTRLANQDDMVNAEHGSSANEQSQD